MNLTPIALAARLVCGADPHFTVNLVDCLVECFAPPWLLRARWNGSAALFSIEQLQAGAA